MQLGQHTREVERDDIETTPEAADVIRIPPPRLVTLGNRKGMEVDLCPSEEDIHSVLVVHGSIRKGKNE